MTETGADQQHPLTHDPNCGVVRASPPMNEADKTATMALSAFTDPSGAAMTLLQLHEKPSPSMNEADKTTMAHTTTAESSVLAVTVNNTPGNVTPASRHTPDLLRQNLNAHPLACSAAVPQSRTDVTVPIDDVVTPSVHDLNAPTTQIDGTMPPPFQEHIFRCKHLRTAGLIVTILIWIRPLLM